MRRQLTTKCIANDQGFALVITLMILALLTVIGTAAINTTSFELKIAGNERMARQRFIAADSGWKQSGPYLDAKNAPPEMVNTGQTPYDWTVRNFGDGGKNQFNDDFSGNKDGQVNQMPYWYKIEYLSDSAAQGFSQGYRSFQYQVICNANGKAQVGARVRKVYQVGY